MKKLFFLILLWPAIAFGAFTEFYCDASAGSNLNSGSTTSGSAAYTATNGGWNSGTGVFTPASGDPSATVSVGDFASVYTDGATVTGFVGRVTAVNSTTITVSTTAKSGTAPTTAGSGISCKVGGAWKGPNGAEDFPWDFIAAAQTNSSGDVVRVNHKSGTNYAITASIAPNQAGPIVMQGYTTTPGDGGRATIDGGTSGASYVLINAGTTADDWAVLDFIVQNNGATGSNGLVTIPSGGDRWTCRRVKVANSRGHGLSASGIGLHVEIEATACNQSNTANLAGLTSSSGVNTFIRCYSHDNTGSNAHGFMNQSANSVLIGCILESNGGDGFRKLFSTGMVTLIGCEIYNNGSDGAEDASSSNNAASWAITNCNFVGNAGWGFNGNSSGKIIGTMLNCGFGSGTAANGSGTTTGTQGMVESGTVTYASNVTPWVDGPNADFRISLAAAKGAGHGIFPGAGSTIGYPDIGAAQHRDAKAGFSIP